MVWYGTIDGMYVASRKGGVGEAPPKG